MTTTIGYAAAQPTLEDEPVELARYRAGCPAIRPHPVLHSEAWIRDRIVQRRSCSGEHYHGAMRSMQSTRLRERLPELDADTLVLCGGLDALLPANLKDFGAMPRAILGVIPWAGHEIVVDDPVRCADDIYSFLLAGARPLTAPGPPRPRARQPSRL